MATRLVVVGTKIYPAGSIGMWGLWDCAAILNVISRVISLLYAMPFFVKQKIHTVFFQEEGKQINYRYKTLTDSSSRTHYKQSY